MFEVSTRHDNPLDADTAGDTQTNTAPVFVTEQSLRSFTGMTAVVQMTWKVFQAAAGSWADSAWMAGGVALVVGAAQFLPIQPGQHAQVTIHAAIFAWLNTGILWAAALGISTRLPG
jgi:hypothetical protein